MYLKTFSLSLSSSLCTVRINLAFIMMSTMSHLAANYMVERQQRPQPPIITAAAIIIPHLRHQAFQWAHTNQVAFPHHITWNKEIQIFRIEKRKEKKKLTKTHYSMYANPVKIISLFRVRKKNDSMREEIAYFITSLLHMKGKQKKKKK